MRPVPCWLLQLLLSLSLEGGESSVTPTFLSGHWCGCMSEFLSDGSHSKSGLVLFSPPSMEVILKSRTDSPSSSLWRLSCPLESPPLVSLLSSSDVSLSLDVVVDPLVQLYSGLLPRVTAEKVYPV